MTGEKSETPNDYRLDLLIIYPFSSNLPTSKVNINLYLGSNDYSMPSNR